MPAGGREGGHPFRTVSRLPRPALLALAGLVFFGLPSLAIASVITLAHQESEIVVEPALFELYDYASGETVQWQSAAEFGRGEFAGTAFSETGGFLQIAPAGADAIDGVTAPTSESPTWWSEAWQMRTCQTISHTVAGASTVSQYPIQFDLDLRALVAADRLQSDFGDLRAIAADGVTQLPLWVDVTGQRVWVQVDTINAGSSTTPCVYFSTDEPQAPLPNHGLEAVFTYVEAKPLYFAVQSDYDVLGDLPIEPLPEVTVPEIADPDSTDPATTDPDGTPPEITAPKITVPESTEPTLEPDAASSSTSIAPTEPAETTTTSATTSTTTTSTTTASSTTPSEPEPEVALPTVIGVQLAVAAMFDDTSVEVRTNGVTTDYVIQGGQLRSISGVQSSTVIAATGPLSGRVDAPGFDTLLPLSWATTSAVIPWSIGSQQIDFAAPFGPATVQVRTGGSDGEVIATVNVPANGTASWVESDGTAVDTSGSVSFTSTRPVLALHHRNDSFGGTFPVVNGSGALVGTAPSMAAAVAPTGTLDPESPLTLSRDRAGSDQAVEYETLNGDVFDPGAQSLGGEAMSLSALSPAEATLGAFTISGNDAASFLPLSELSSRYVIPSSTAELHVVCPDPSTELRVTSGEGISSTISCDGLSIAGALDQVPHLVIPQTLLDEVILPGRAITVSSTSGASFGLTVTEGLGLAIGQQSNVLGAAQGRQVTWPAPQLSQTIEGLVPTTGTWRSGVVDLEALAEAAGSDATDVFGQIRFDVDQPLDEAGQPIGGIQIRIATGDDLPLGPAVGPDGTTETFYRPDQIAALDPSHDGDHLLRVEVSVSSPDPTRSPSVRSMAIDHNLRLLDRSPGQPIELDIAGAGPHYLVRLRSLSDDLVATETRSITASADVLTANGITVDAVRFLGADGQTGPSPQPFDRDRPVSLLADIAFTGVEEGSAQLDLAVNLAGPGVRSTITINLNVAQP